MFEDWKICLSYCKKPYKSVQEVSNHLTNEHQIYNEHFCLKCEGAFPSKALLAIHLIDIHEHNEQEVAEGLGTAKVFEEKKRERFQCDVCKRILKCEKSLIRHKKQYHEKHLHDYKCDQCNFTAYENAQLTSHILRKHTKASRFPCDQCSYVTNFLAQLHQHVRQRHDGHRGYTQSCNVCGKQCNGKGVLADHMLHEHDIVYKF